MCLHLQGEGFSFAVAEHFTCTSRVQAACMLNQAGKRSLRDVSAHFYLFVFTVTVLRL